MLWRTSKYMKFAATKSQKDGFCHGPSSINTVERTTVFHCYIMQASHRASKVAAFHSTTGGIVNGQTICTQIKIKNSQTIGYPPFLPLSYIDMSTRRLSSQ